MKSFIFLLTFLLSNAVFAQNILDNCRDASLATGYVYENTLSVSVDGAKLSKEDQEIFWTMLTDDVFTLVKHYPASYQLGDYFGDKKINFTFKLSRDTDAALDSRLEEKQRSLIYYMGIIDGVKLSCAYIL